MTVLPLSTCRSCLSCLGCSVPTRTAVGLSLHGRSHLPYALRSTRPLSWLYAECLGMSLTKPGPDPDHRTVHIPTTPLLLLLVGDPSPALATLGTRLWTFPLEALIRRFCLGPCCFPCHGRCFSSFSYCWCWLWCWWTPSWSALLACSLSWPS